MKIRQFGDLAEDKQLLLHQYFDTTFYFKGTRKDNTDANLGLSKSKMLSMI